MSDQSSDAVVQHQPAPPSRSADGTVHAQRLRHALHPPKSSGSGTGAAAPLHTPPHSAHRVLAAAAPGANPGIGAVLPAGGASAAVMLLHDPQAMHDVAFYQAIAEELPASPVVQSILYTHRSVVDDAPTCEEALASVDKSVRKWREVHAAQLAASLAQQEEQLQAQAADAAKEAELRELEHRRAMDRLTASVADLEQRVDRSLRYEDAALAQSRAEMERRAKERHERIAAACARIQNVTEQRQVQQRELDVATGQAKLGINETLERGLVLSAEESARIALRFAAANSKQRVSIFEECVESREFVAGGERSERKALSDWVVLVHERVRRAIRALDIVRSLIAHNFSSEAGLRSNVEHDEAHEFAAIAAAFNAGPRATAQADAVELLVFSAAIGLHPALFDDHSPRRTTSSATNDNNDDGSSGAAAAASEAADPASDRERIVEAFFRNFLVRSEQTQRLAFFLNSRLRRVALDGDAERASLQRAEVTEREEILRWMAAQEDRELRRRDAQRIIAELADHPITREHSERLLTEFAQRRELEGIYAVMRDERSAIVALAVQ